MSRWLPRPPVLDAAMAVGFALVAEVERSVSPTNVWHGTAAPGLDAVLVVVPVVPLLWRRRRPFETLVATTVALGVVGGVFHGTVCFFGGLFVLLTALYAASSYGVDRADKVALVVPFGLYAALPLFTGSYFRFPADFVFATVLTAGTWLAGQGARQWRRQSNELATALEEVDSARAAQAELAVQAERTRLARELHDIVTHSLSVVVLQANRARLELHERPSEAEDAVVAIESTGREALVEMRRLLGVLRSSPYDGAGSTSEARLAPAPGLADLPTLLDRMRRSGLDVVASGEVAPPLPAALDLTAYRIVQESLTNALRHARPRTARVELSREEGTVRLLVTSPVGRHLPDEPHRARGAGEGQGLIGVRERVGLFGGTCRIGDEGAGSFVVDARLPVPDRAVTS